jgi:diacylglycerol O-acyltransferase / wax synthase
MQDHKRTVVANDDRAGDRDDKHDDRLSWGDTIFLHLEREGMPLNVASVCVFDGDIPFQACIQFIESKLPLIPRYLKRVVPAPLGFGLPHWEYDSAFDIRNHVRQITLKHGSETELKTLAGKILSTVMDRRHPLWDLTFVHGLKGHRGGLIFRLHHCLADGIAGVGIMNLLLDTTPKMPRLVRRKLHVPIAQTPDIITSLTTGLLNSYSDLLKRTFEGYANVTTIAGRLAANGAKLGTEDFTGLLPEIGASTKRLRFNVPYRGPQKFAWAEIPLAKIKAIKSACGTSVNDVILALVTATIRRYLEMHGDRVKGRLFRVMIPVNLRGADGPGELGNCISLVPVTVPLDIRDPRKLLAAVHKRMEFLKRGQAAELVSLVGGLIGMIPTSARELAGHVISRLPFTPFNMVCTNVPGPQYPLFLLGRKLLHCYPYVPIGGEMNLNSAILTYDGTAYFGFSGDAHAVPDLPCLETFLKLSFAELYEAAGLRTAHQQEENKKTKKRARSVIAEEQTPTNTTMKTKIKTKTKTTTHTKRKTKAYVASTPVPSASSPVPVAASVPPRPGASLEPARRPIPSIVVKKVPTQLIA